MKKLDIRHRLSEFLLQFGGHIGYSVRKSERRKGYAKTIIHNGGVLENEVSEDEHITQRYWITLDNGKI